MQGLIPKFIIAQYRAGKHSGFFDASILLFDVSGFTPLTEKLSLMGHAGAETLSEILNSLYNFEVLKKIRNEDGFVSGFSGDSFTVILPHKNNLSLIKFAEEIMSMLVAGTRSKKEESFGLTFKAGISSGMIEWGIVGDVKKSWFFKGSPVTHANKAASLANPGTVHLISDEFVEKKRIKPNEFIKVRNSRRVESAFFPDILTDSKNLNEFRRVFSLFVSCNPTGHLERERFVNYIHSLMNLTDRYGGFVNGIHLDETGTYVLVLFGAPWSFENDAERAMLFAHEVVKKTDLNIRIGMSVGIVYAGLMGFPGRKTYTVLGKQVNSASRIMRCSNKPGVFIAEEVLEYFTSGTYDALSKSNIALKGTKGLTTVIEVSPDFLQSRFLRFNKRLIGRDKELVKISSAASFLERGHNGGCIIVSGLAGIGKSHLIEEAGNIICNKNIKRITLYCSDISNLGFEPFRAFLRDFFHQEFCASVDVNQIAFLAVWNDLMDKLKNNSETEVIRQELARTISMLQALIGIASEDSFYFLLAAKSRYENTIVALRTLFLALSRIQPLLIIIEDFHWMEHASTEVIALLSRAATSFPFLMVLSCRPFDDGSIPELNLNSKNIQEVKLGSINTEFLSELVEGLVNGKADDSLINFIEERTRCNPFYVEQYSRYLLESECIRMVDGFWKIVVEPDSIPRGINNILQARLDRLPKELREVVMTASVLGTEFNLSILEKMLSGRDISKILESGTRVRVWSDFSDMIYIFQHALLRDTAYAMQLKGNLRKSHNLAAAAIEELYPNNELFYSDLAYHFEQAGKIPKAIESLDKAIISSQASYNLLETIKYLDKLLLFFSISEFRNSKKELKTLALKANLLSTLGRWEEAIQSTEKREELAVKCSKTSSVAEALLARAWMKTQLGFLEEANDLVDRATELYQSINNKEGLAKAHGRRGIIFFRKSDFESAEASFLDTLSMLEGIDNPQEILKNTTNLGCVYKDRGENSKAEKCFEDAIEIARNNNMLDSLSTIIGNRGTLSRNQGKYMEATRDFQESVKISEKIGDRKTLSSNLGGLALIKYDQGNFKDAVKLYQRQLEIAIDLNFTLGEAEANGYLGGCFEELKQYELAEKHYDTCIEISRKIGMSYYVGIFLVLKAGMFFKCERLIEAEKLNNEGIIICKEIGISEMVCTGNLLTERLRIKNATSISETREALYGIKALVKNEKNQNARALIQHIYWKHICELPHILKKEFDLESVHYAALKEAVLAYEKNPAYSNKEILTELESANS